MPVTELAWIPSATPGSISEKLLTACWKGITAQSEWVAKHARSTLPSGPPAVRGAALYQQREDTGVMLVTAHWDSPAQHAECIASHENKQAMAAMAPHVLRSEISILHVEGVHMLGEKTLDTGILSIARIGIDETKRVQIEALWDRVKELLCTGAECEHLGGWRIEDDLDIDGRDEFIIVGAWRDEDALRRFTDGDIGLAWDKTWRDFARDVRIDVKTYRRIA
ncbi:hypothetical protein GGS21DRAFT_197578 [Xylaria nigripes]|nr:hypothetical protein GGS21DRAFT_197578 [Xylaria nigripes]